MDVKYKEWIDSRYKKFPIIRDALLQYWKTVFDLTKTLKPENFLIRTEEELNKGFKDFFRPLIRCEVEYEDPQYYNGIEGWIIKILGNYPENPDRRREMESAIVNLLSKIPDIHVLISSVDITPFLNLTPDLLYLSLERCKSTKILSPKIGLPSLKKLYTIRFWICDDLEHIPPEIGNLPQLKSLVFEVCLNLKEIPTEIGNLPNLRELKIMSCDSLKTVPVSICEIPTFSKFVVVSQPANFKIPRCLDRYYSDDW